ncbi:MAG: mechanosensitive ion channel protein, partial [Limnohabitans sp.]
MNALSEFFAQWSQDGLSPSLLNELGWLLAALAVAWLIVKLLSRHAAPASVLFGRRLIDGLLFPALALGLVYIGQLWLGRDQNLSLLKLAVPVLLSLVFIRLCARVLTAVFPQSPLAVLTERLISWLAWLIAVLWITDLLPVVVHEMEQVRFNFGKTRMDLRSLVEGVLSSGLVLVLTLWVSATIEHRVLAQTVSDLSMRKIATNVLRAVLPLVGLLLALSAVGVDLTALSVLGGALGVGLGLGLQKLAANYVSGFVVLVERSV